MSRSCMISVLAVLALMPTLAAGQGYVVRRSFTPGNYELIIEDKARQTTQGLRAKAPAVLETVSRVEFAARVTPPGEDGRFEMVLTVRRFLQSVKTRGRSLVCDTAVPDEAPSRLRQILLPMIGQKLTVQLDSYSRVLKVSGLDDAWTRRAKHDPDLARAVERIRQEMGDALVKEVLDQITEKLPAVAVTPTKSWYARMHYHLPYLGRRRHRQVVEFRKVTAAGLAVLVLSGKVADKTESVVRKDPPVLKTRNLTVTQTGQIEIGLKGPQPSYRLILSRTSNLDMTAETAETKETPAVKSPVKLTQTFVRRATLAPWTPPATRPATQPATRPGEP